MTSLAEAPLDQLEARPLPPFGRLAHELDEVEWHPYYTGPFAAFEESQSTSTEWDLPAIVASTEAGCPILDLGAGTGRVALHLAERGRAVTGVDRSSEAVSTFRRRLAVRPELAALVSIVEGDFLDPSCRVGGPFGSAVLAALSINAFPGDDQIRALLGRIRELLTPGGALCVVVFDEEGVNEMRQYRGQLFAIPYRDQDGAQHLMWTALRFDAGTRFLRQTLLVQVPAPSAGKEKMRSHMSSVIERMWTPADLKPLMEEAGFSLRQRIGCRLEGGGAGGASASALAFERCR